MLGTKVGLVGPIVVGCLSRRGLVSCTAGSAYPSGQIKICVCWCEGWSPLGGFGASSKAVVWLGITGSELVVGVSLSSHLAELCVVEVSHWKSVKVIVLLYCGSGNATTGVVSAVGYSWCPRSPKLRSRGRLSYN